jgi:hypothetical protein
MLIDCFFRPNLSTYILSSLILLDCTSCQDTEVLAVPEKTMISSISSPSISYRTSAQIS